MEEIYTPQEIADYLKVTLRTVYQWIHEGKLKSYKVGTLWRVHKSDLEEFIKQSTNK
jgi:excisionase family DNA binding protein